MTNLEPNNRDSLNSSLDEKQLENETNLEGALKLGNEENEGDEYTKYLGDNTIDKERLWNTIGFHRVTAGFFYSYILLLGGAVIGLITVGTILPTFLPYPEIEGYKRFTATVLGYFFGVMDFNLGGGGGFSDGMSRFIGQYADTNPRRSLKYIQFYVWFQMFSGLIQVTMVAIIVFTYLIHTSLSYLIWFILGQSLVQYPGFLMIMESCLKSFQRGDKLAWLSWLQDTIFQVSINIIFMIIGKRWGEANPEIGALMGITLFYILSQFMDDWFNLIIGGIMFHKVLKERGLDEGVWLIFKPEFDKEVVKEALIFTGKQWLGNTVILGAVGYIISMVAIGNVYGLASWTGLLLIPNFIGNLVKMAGPMGSQAVPAISESYNNGKTELAQYFIHDLLKYYTWITTFFAISLLIIVPRILHTIVDNFPALENYEAGIFLIPYVLFIEATAPYRGLWNKLFIACDDPMPPIYLNAIFSFTGFALQALFLYYCITLDTWPAWYYILFPGFINDFVKSIFGWIWLTKKKIKIDFKKIFWQVIMANILAGIVYAFVLILINNTVWILIEKMFEPVGNWAVSAFSLGSMGVTGTAAGQILAALVMLLFMLFFYPGGLYAPIYAFFGGWDDFTMEELRKTAVLSGPSKFLVMFIYKLSKSASKLSKWSNKFPIADYDLIKNQIVELVKEGHAAKLLS